MCVAAPCWGSGHLSALWDGHLTMQFLHYLWLVCQCQLHIGPFEHFTNLALSAFQKTAISASSAMQLHEGF